MYELKYVLAQVCKQHPGEVVTAALFPPKDFLILMDEKAKEFREFIVKKLEREIQESRRKNYMNLVLRYTNEYN